MSRIRTISDFENELEGLQGSIALSVKYNEEDLLFEYDYPEFQKLADELKISLEKISMYAPVKAALAQSAMLAREAKYLEAENVILEINRALMKASGTWDKMVKRYPPKNVG